MPFDPDASPQKGLHTLSLTIDSSNFKASSSYQISFHLLEQFGQVIEDEEVNDSEPTQFKRDEMSCSLRFFRIKLGLGTFVKSMSSLTYAIATFWNLESLVLKVSNSGDTDAYV